MKKETIKGECKMAHYDDLWDYVDCDICGACFPKYRNDAKYKYVNSYDVKRNPALIGYDSKYICDSCMVNIEGKYKSSMLEKVRERFNGVGYIDDNTVVSIDGYQYVITLEDEEEVIDEGEYQYGAYIYAFRCGESVIYYRTAFSQTGCYFSCQERKFEPFEEVELATKKIQYWRSKQLYKL